MLRLLYIAAAIGPSAGGLAKDVPGLCREMARRDHQVTLLANGDPPTGVACDYQVQHQESYEIRYFRPPPGSSYLRRWGASPAYAREMRKYIQNADIAHIYSFYNLSSRLGAACALRAGVPYVMEPHGSLDDFVFLHHRWRKRIYERLVMKSRLEQAGAVRFMTEAEAETAGRNLRAQLPGVVVPTGLDPDEARPAPIRLATYAIDERCRDQLIVFVGRLHKKKGLDLLANAFVKVARNNPLAHLVIVGPDDGMKAEIEAIFIAAGVRSRVTFTGMLLGQAKIDLMAAARVVAVPSYGENFCNVVIEALALGVPVVLSDRVALYPEIARTGAGLVVGLDADELAHALAELLRDEASARAMGEAGLALVRDKFTWRAVGEQLESVYLNLIEQHRQRRRA